MELLYLKMGKTVEQVDLEEKDQGLNFEYHIFGMIIKKSN